MSLTELMRSAAMEATRAQPSMERQGKVLRLTGMMIEAHVPDALVGAVVEIDRAGEPLLGEVVGFRDQVSLIIPLSDLRGVAPGARVTSSPVRAEVPAPDALLGRVIDAFGHPLDGGPPIARTPSAPLDRTPPSIAQRARISVPIETSVRAIDVLLTCGRGQRIGLFAGAGVGKTMLIRQIAAQSTADVVVVGLVGERGGEVRDLLDSDLGPRSIVVVATSDRSALERARGALAATAIAERFRDEGKHVLLVIDSLTRYAMALREIGLAAGEPPATKGYPPSVFAQLPRLLERAAPMKRGGSITGFYTVLVEGDDLADPVADSARSLLDGHIVLSRDLAARGHFPAIDLLQSASRSARQVATSDTLSLADQARSILARKREADDLRSLGAYTPGSNPVLDEAMDLGTKILEWARQQPEERSAAAAAAQSLAQILRAKPAGGAR